jgi:hypothetical protein
LNLFQGQIINWDIQEGDEGMFIRLFTGNLRVLGEDAAYQELFGKKGKGAKKCRKFGKSAEKRVKRIEDARNPQRGEAIELRNLLSGLSEYLLGLQGRLGALCDD